MSEDISAVRSSISRIREHMGQFSKQFFKELFARAPNTRRLFDSEEARRRKLGAMLATINNAKGLEKLAGILRKVGERHEGYGVVAADYQPLVQALLVTVENVDPQGSDPLLQEEWKELLGKLVALMEPSASLDCAVEENAVAGKEDIEQAPDIMHELQVVDASLYDEVGGSDTIHRVHLRFYQTLFDDPWLGVFFYGKSQTSLAMKQTRFMVAAFGGPDEYRWESPAVAHMHMHVTDEQADIREVLLRNAIRAEGLSMQIEARWLKVDQAFRSAIVKQHPSECVVRCPGQQPVIARKPANYQPPRLLTRDELEQLNEVEEVC
ncbi:hypothetical protein F6455_05090 [Proteobacteria bacterium 005FR1]|nr:hypothetical protein [Proteobacteria bacterium 005FR1]